jgi:hypothetical protein
MDSLSRASSSLLRRLSHLLASTSRAPSSTVASLTQTAYGRALEANGGPLLLESSQSWHQLSRNVSVLQRQKLCTAPLQRLGRILPTQGTDQQQWFTCLGQANLHRSIHSTSSAWTVARPGVYVTLNNIRDNPRATKSVRGLPPLL